MFKLRLSLKPMRRAAKPRRARPVPALADGIAEVDGGDERPPGCGWYESSHELAQGLSVSTHDADHADMRIPLGWWLRWETDSARR